MRCQFACFHLQCAQVRKTCSKFNYKTHRQSQLFKSAGYTLCNLYIRSYSRNFEIYLPDMPAQTAQNLLSFLWQTNIAFYINKYTACAFLICLNLSTTASSSSSSSCSTYPLSQSCSTKDLSPQLAVRTASWSIIVSKILDLTI